MTHSYSVTAASAASPERVFDVLTHGATWPSWSPIDEFKPAGGGDPDGPQGVGAVRLFRTGRQVSREPIVELVPARRFVYVNESPPWRHYRGVVDLAPSAAGGTLITWSGTFTPLTRGTGWFWRLFLTAFMRRMANGLAAYAAGPRPG
ncbi:SRPBCC family protein [Actinoplanes sp. NPDC049265]|uniref:SRPBCC family protein n=1 Tax=Actinoplanes sp. NPDC049265 TaxID=3363902 RepID=UPI003715A2CB